MKTLDEQSEAANAEDFDLLPSLPLLCAAILDAVVGLSANAPLSPVLKEFINNLTAAVKKALAFANTKRGEPAKVAAFARLASLAVGTFTEAGGPVTGASLRQATDVIEALFNNMNKAVSEHEHEQQKQAGPRIERRSSVRPDGGRQEGQAQQRQLALLAVPPEELEDKLTELTSKLDILQDILDQTEMNLFNKEYVGSQRRRLLQTLKDLSSVEGIGAPPLFSTSPLSDNDPASRPNAKMAEQSRRVNQAVTAQNGADHVIIDANRNLEEGQRIIAALRVEMDPQRQEALEEALRSLTDLILRHRMAAAEWVKSAVKMVARLALLVNVDVATASEVEKTLVDACLESFRTPAQAIGAARLGFKGLYEAAAKRVLSGDINERFSTRVKQAQQRFKLSLKAPPRVSAAASGGAKGVRVRCTVPNCPVPTHQTKNHRKHVDVDNRQIRPYRVRPGAHSARTLSDRVRPGALGVQTLSAQQRGSGVPQRPQGASYSRAGYPQQSHPQPGPPQRQQSSQQSAQQQQWHAPQQQQWQQQQRQQWQAATPASAASGQAPPYKRPRHGK